MSYAGWRISLVLSQLLGELGMSCVTAPRRGHWEACAQFPLNFIHVPFPFADFVSCPFTVISHGREYSSMLSPVSPSRELLNLGMVLGAPTQIHTPFQNSLHLWKRTFLVLFLPLCLFLNSIFRCPFLSQSIKCYCAVGFLFQRYFIHYSTVSDSFQANDSQIRIFSPSLSSEFQSLYLTVKHLHFSGSQLCQI